MRYIDRIYGPVDFTEDILVDVIHSNAMERLNGVLQHGISGLLGVTRATTRFEHSLGVMILVRRFGGDIEEQVAALLHDISHTAFSHVIDYVFHDHDGQSYHEDHKESYLAASDIPAVLGRHGMDWRTFLHDEDFALLEQPSPALCADRLDYFLRDAVDLRLASLGDIERAAGHLIVHQGKVAVANVETALWMADTFLAADHASWSNFREVGLYELCAQAIRMGLAEGTITEADLWTTDEAAWHKLHKNKSLALQDVLSLVSPETQFEWNESAPTFWVSTKIRTIDPPVLVDGNLLPLSTLDLEFAHRRAVYIQNKSGKWPVRVIPPDQR